MAEFESNGGDHKCRGITRRSFLADTGLGFTGLALGALLFENGIARADAPAPLRDGRVPPAFGTGSGGLGPHFSPRAKSVIWIFMCGGVSHLESFDVKPELTKYGGKSVDETPFKALFDEKKFKEKIVGGNPAHMNRKVLMPLQTGYKAYGQ